MLAPGVPSITYALRGLNYYEIEITGPAQDLHSGIFGGAVPNPLTILSELFAKLHDKNFHPESLFLASTTMSPRAPQGRAQRLNAALQGQRISQDRRRARALRRKRLHRRRTALVPAHARAQRHLRGGYTGEGAKTVIPKSPREILHAPRIPGKTREKITTLVERHGRASLPENGHLQVQRAQRGQSLGSALHAPVLRGRPQRARKRFRQARRLHP